MLIRGNNDDVSDYRYQQSFTEICDYKEIYDSVGKEKYGLVLSHYPIFSWKNMGRGKILLYGHTHESEERMPTAIVTHFKLGVYEWQDQSALFKA